MREKKLFRWSSSCISGGRRFMSPNHTVQNTDSSSRQMRANPSYTHTVESAGITPFTCQSQKHRESSHTKAKFVGIIHAHTKAQAYALVGQEATYRHSRWWHVPRQRASSLYGGKAHHRMLPLTACAPAQRAASVDGGMWCHHNQWQYAPRGA
jgi:hypothetical protein